MSANSIIERTKFQFMQFHKFNRLAVVLSGENERSMRKRFFFRWLREGAFSAIADEVVFMQGASVGIKTIKEF